MWALPHHPHLISDDVDYLQSYALPSEAWIEAAQSPRGVVANARR